MKLSIPKIGTRIVLTAPWTFMLTDESRNETFWLGTHGTANRTTYYYGYGHGVAHTPTATPATPYKGTTPSKPMATTIPKGTALFVESYHIQKGHEPRIALRIKKGNTTKISTGKFLASVDDINKMEVESELLEKYPKGRFGLRVTHGIDDDTYKCTCQGYGYGNCSCGRPQYTDRMLVWESNPDSSRLDKKRAGICHRTDTAGVDTMKPAGFGYYYSRRSDYNKSFDNIQEVLTWAVKKGCTQAHIDAFIKVYEPERIEWEKSKA